MSERDVLIGVIRSVPYGPFVIGLRPFEERLADALIATGFTRHRRTAKATP
jgi:hypothetical protein